MSTVTEAKKLLETARLNAMRDQRARLIAKLTALDERIENKQIVIEKLAEGTDVVVDEE